MILISQSHIMNLNPKHSPWRLCTNNNYNSLKITKILSRKLSYYTTLNTNKTEPFIQSNHDANYAELINSIQFSLPAMDDFISKSPTLYNYFYKDQTEIHDTLLYQTQQQDPVLRQFLIWKHYKIPPNPFTHYTSK